MTLTNVEKELIATHINKLEESFEKVMEMRGGIFMKVVDPELTEPIGEVREIINDLKKYWVERQQ